MSGALVMADLHAHNYKQHSHVLPDGMNSRLRDCVSCLAQARALAVANGCDLFMLPGDIFNTRGAVRPSVYMAVEAELKAFVDEGIDVRISPGNHDLEDFRGGWSAADLFNYSNGWNDILVCGAVKPMFDRKHEILMIPYIHNVEEFKEAFVSGCRKCTPRYVMMHQGIDDFAGPGYGLTTISAPWLEEKALGAMVFSGHYHTPQALGCVYSVGAPLQHNFADEGDKRGVLIVDRDPSSHIAYEFHELDYPRFVTVDLDEPTHELTHVDGCFVRIKSTDPKAAQEAAKTAEKAGALDVVVRVGKKFTAAHAKPVKPDAPDKMLAEFCDLAGGDFASHKTEILREFNRICLT